MYADAALATVRGFPTAAIAFPRDQLIGIRKTDIERVIELPIIMRRITPSVSRHFVGKLGIQRPPCDINFVSAVIQRLSRAPIREPVPVVWMNVAFVLLSWG